LSPYESHLAFFRESQKNTTDNPTKKETKNMKEGLYANIHAKRKRIAQGSGEKMRKAGQKGAPSAGDFRKSAKTAKSVNVRKMYE
jgi:hypothetical protein